MSGVTSIEVKESEQELQQLLQEQTSGKMKERLQVLYLLKLPEALSISQLAKVIGKHRGTVKRWLMIYRDQGLDALLEVKKSPGRPRVIPEWAVVSLKSRLEQAESGFKSYVSCAAMACGQAGSYSRVSNSA